MASADTQDSDLAPVTHRLASALAVLAAKEDVEGACWTAESGETPIQWAQRLGLPETQQLTAMADVLDIEFTEDLGTFCPSQPFVETIPIGHARQHAILGLTGSDDQLKLAMGHIDSWTQLDLARRLFEKDVVPLLAPPKEIQRLINIAYQERSGEAQTLIETMDKTDVLADLEALSSREDLLDVEGRAPVIRLVNLMLFEAVKTNASDVHIQPYENRVVVRFRVDGLLFDSFDVLKQLQEEVVSRVKVLGQMDIAEKRLPQDGRATVQVGDRTIDLRIASLPGAYGERVVLRLLDKSARLYSLPEIGMDTGTLKLFREAIRYEHGLILVTGPTGSGKSTTLYAALQEINTRDRNVVTLEDPIEYQVEGISQTQINTKKGLTFAAGLRSILRQDPDIIMVGEIRDHETAELAIQSALTGHLVFSTLHTNDAASAVTRLLDLGIEPYLVSSSLLAVLAQRLVRQVCDKCARNNKLGPDEEEFFRSSGIDVLPDQLAVGEGCPACRETGYRRRIGIFEYLSIDEQVRRKVQLRESANEIRDVALEQGMKLLREDGVNKIIRGMTTIDEIRRVTMRATL